LLLSDEDKFSSFYRLNPIYLMRKSILKQKSFQERDFTKIIGKVFFYDRNVIDTKK